MFLCDIAGGQESASFPDELGIEVLDIVTAKSKLKIKCYNCTMIVEIVYLEIFP